ncbi:helix-hairpin-helix domain-containing protein [Microbacterium sp. H1-D42]|uniref:ComEA family DNA-binding protein n=1 Tax=Microbacterium sp. H1-D42 TaxID=2925844 RepID=UPI001F53509B|nr:helix-hairpin-helix domain-containing protein [Microbacterium sp. H1-D42]UNK72232.1 helix-hairpin-helix domain-containing protein [Microbacterium sp. H1-D42]
MSTARTAEGPTIGWMLGMSTWMISAFIPGSYLSWLGFLIIGIVGRMLRWTITGVVLGVLAILVHLPIWGQWQPLLAALVYIAGMVLALMANPGWLRAMWERRAGGSTSAVSSSAASSGETRAARRAKARQNARTAADEARTEATARETARQQDERRQASGRRGGSRSARSSNRSTTDTAQAQTARAAQTGPTEADQLAARAGASSAEFFDAPAQATDEAAEPVDVNTADADALAGLPGITARQARKLVKQRTAQGGFASLDAFATAAGVQPHELVRLRDAAVCSRPPRGPRQFGRRVDY